MRALGIMGGTAICVLVLVAVILTEGRIAATFAQPVAYARSFFYRDTLRPYGEPDRPPSPMISIGIDPLTGEAQVNPAQPLESGNPAMKLDVIGSAAQDARGLAPPASRGAAPRPSPTLPRAPAP